MEINEQQPWMEYEYRTIRDLSTTTAIIPTRVDVSSTSIEEKEEKHVNDVNEDDDIDVMWHESVSPVVSIEDNTISSTSTSTPSSKLPVDNPIPALIAAHLAAQAQAQAQADAAATDTQAQTDVIPIPGDPHHISHFTLRIFILLLIMWLTHIITSCICILIPLCTGRLILSFSPFRTTLRYHDIYALLIGFYLYAGLIFLTVRTIIYLRDHDWLHSCHIACTWLITIMKWIFLSVFLLGILPLLTGTLFQLVIVMPIRWHTYPTQQQNVLPVYQVKKRKNAQCDCIDDVVVICINFYPSHVSFHFYRLGLLVSSFFVSGLVLFSLVFSVLIIHGVLDYNISNNKHGNKYKCII